MTFRICIPLVFAQERAEQTPGATWVTHRVTRARLVAFTLLNSYGGGLRGSFGSLALFLDPAALPRDAAECPPLRVSGLIRQAGFRVDAAERRLDGSGRSRCAKLSGDLLVRRKALEARPGEPRAAQALNHLALK